MKFIFLNPQSNTPMYQQIIQQIENAISHGKLKHLDKLPSESFFERVYHVSPIVVKQAYARLKEKKLIETGRGFQAYVSIRKKHVIHYALFSHKNQLLLKHQSRLMLSTVRDLSNSELFDFESSQLKVIETKRLFCIDDFPVYLQTNILLHDSYKSINALDIDMNVGIFTLNSLKTKHQITSNELLYYPKKADYDIAAILEIEPYAPIHFFKYIHLDHDKIVGISYHYLPGQYIDLIRED